MRSRAAVPFLAAALSLAAAATVGADESPPAVVASTAGMAQPADAVVCVPCSPCGGCGFESPCCPSRWSFDVTIPLWLPSLHGEFGSRSGVVEANGRATRNLLRDLGDTIESVDWFFSGAVVAERGPWRIAVDVMAASVSNTWDLRLLGLEATGTFRALFGFATVGWEGWQRPIGRCGACLRAGPYIGVRAFSTSFEYTNVAGGRTEGSHTWFDPLVGFGAEVRTPRGWIFRGAADVGGVSEEQWSWALQGSVRIPISRRVGLSLGWRFLDSTFTEGSGDRFLFDGSLNGPIAGISIVF